MLLRPGKLRHSVTILTLGHRTLPPLLLVYLSDLSSSLFRVPSPLWPPVAPDTGHQGSSPRVIAPAFVLLLWQISRVFLRVPQSKGLVPRVVLLGGGGISKRRRTHLRVSLVMWACPQIGLWDSALFSLSIFSHKGSGFTLLWALTIISYLATGSKAVEPTNYHLKSPKL